MSNIGSIRDLINLWPTRADAAKDMMDRFAGLRVTTAQVHKWAEKQSIPSKYQHPILCAGIARGFPITAELMIKLHAPSVQSADPAGSTEEVSQ